MRFRLGMAAGFCAGYYLGAKAGTERYEQINRALAKVRGSSAFRDLRARVQATAESTVATAKQALDDRVHPDRDPVAEASNGSAATPHLPPPWPETPRP